VVRGAVGSGGKGEAEALRGADDVHVRDHVPEVAVHQHPVRLHQRRVTARAPLGGGDRGVIGHRSRRPRATVGPACATCRFVENGGRLSHIKRTLITGVLRIACIAFLVGIWVGTCSAHPMTACWRGKKMSFFPRLCVTGTSSTICLCHSVC